jgi:predicted aspartyl protease
LRWVLTIKLSQLKARGRYSFFGSCEQPGCGCAQHARKNAMPISVRTSLAAACVLCVGFARLASADQEPPWLYQKSIMYLVAKGETREFRYKEPRAALVPFGVTEGTLAFRGVVRDGQYIGTAFKFTRECGALSFPARGPVLGNGKLVRLSGWLTQVNGWCQNTTPPIEQVLEFRMANGLVDVAPPSGVPGGHSPFSKSEVPLKKNSGGTLVVPVEINEAITLDFTVDSGAADVSVPDDVFSTLRRKGTIKDSDIIDGQIFVFADGSKSKSFTFPIKSLQVGGIVVERVMGGVTPKQGDLLLGQSFLGRFKSWSIDNNKKVLLLEQQ